MKTQGIQELQARWFRRDVLEFLMLMFGVASVAGTLLVGLLLRHP